MDYAGLTMLGSWDSMALRLFGAAAVAAAIHAWRKLHHARAVAGRAAGGHAASAREAAEPLLPHHTESIGREDILEVDVLEVEASPIANAVAASIDEQPATAQQSEEQQQPEQQLVEQQPPIQEAREQQEQAAASPEVDSTPVQRSDEPAEPVKQAVVEGGQRAARSTVDAEAPLAVLPLDAQEGGTAVILEPQQPALSLEQQHPAQSLEQPQPALALEQQQQPALSLEQQQPDAAEGVPTPVEAAEEQRSVPVEEEQVASSDLFAAGPSDVHSAALGSPFVPPSLAVPPPPLSLGSLQAAAAIPLFSSFAPPPPPASSVEADVALAAGSVQQPQPGPGAADPTPVTSSGEREGQLFDGGLSAEPPTAAVRIGGDSSPPRHRRRLSLLSAGFDQAQQQGPAPQQAQLVVDQIQALPSGQSGLLSEALAQHGRLPDSPAAAAAVLDADAAPSGRPDLRVEVPLDSEQRAERDREEQPWAPPTAHRYAAQAGEQEEPDLPFQHFRSQLVQQPEAVSPAGHRRLGAASSPAAFHHQQHADAEAAAATAAAAAAAAWASSQQQRQQQAPSSSHPSDSVAAALQRAVHLAASSAAPGYQGGSSSSAGGIAGYNPSQAASGGAGFPSVGLRPPSVGGTYRSGSGSIVYAPAQAGPGGFGVGHAQDSAWGDSGFSMLAERSMSQHGDRHLPRLSEEVEGVRSSVDVDVPLACKLDVVAGPGTNHSYTNTEEVLEIVIGRNQGCSLQLNDGEISGQHAAVRWSSVEKCWKVADLGSLNGTLLNGEPISVSGRKRGRDYRLSTDDILQLGSFTKIKVSTFPRDLLDPLQSRCGSLPIGSMPRSLTMPKHRIPSFSSLLSPKITNTPSKKATVAAASDELRLECCIISRTGRDHQRKGDVCEDVACAECPLHGSEAALGSQHPAALFCVFDGHCGRGAADAASVALPDQVASRLQGARGDLLAAKGAADMLHAAFLATDQAISAEEGCTATAVLMWRDGEGAVCLQAANVGDSAALFIEPLTGQVTEMTEDHRLTNPRERQRLQDMGIQLASNARRLYGLNLCRGLGDKFLKDEDLGLSAEPHVSPVVRLSEEQGGILLIASDGLWDVAEAEAVTQAICQADRETDGSVLETTDAVIAHALKQRTKDDVTALVVRVWPASEWEVRSPTKNLDDGQAVTFVS